MPKHPGQRLILYLFDPQPSCRQRISLTPDAYFLMNE